MMGSTSQYNMSYHVNLSNSTGRVDCTCLGMECVDMVLKHSYSRLDEMPMWVQERISLLMMLESKATLVNIGTKIDEYNFMVNGK